MDEIFKNIDCEKRDRIINSALEEFSRNKFEKASTNNIVKKANISKGLLYHYFSSKKELHEYLEAFVIKIVLKAIEEKLDWNESDFFIRIKQIVMIKFEIINRYPHIYDFALNIYQNKNIEELKKNSETFSPDLYQKIYNYNIDYKKFKDDVDIKKVLSIVRWTFEKYTEELLNTYNSAHGDFDYKAMEKEINQYTEILKSAFYK